MFHPVHLSLFHSAFLPPFNLLLFIFNECSITSCLQTLEENSDTRISTCISLDMNQIKFLVLKFKELFFLINPESKLSESLAERVHGTSYKFCWATCCALPSFEQQGWTRSPEVPSSDCVLTSLQEKVGCGLLQRQTGLQKINLNLYFERGGCGIPS